MNVDRRVRVSLGALIVLLVAMVLAAIVVSSRINSSSHDKFVRDAIPLKTHVQDLALQLVNEETGVRGYLLTGRPESLRPYRQALKAVAADISAIEPYLPRHPIMAGLVADVRPQIAALESFFRSEIALVQSGPAGRRQAQGHVLEGKLRFDRFRATAARMTADTGAFVLDAASDQKRTFDRGLVLLLVLGGGAVAIGIVLLIVTPRRLRRLYDAAVGAQRDAEDAADRVTFLSEAGAVLASSLDYEATLRQLARLAVPRLADWCAVDMVAEDGSIERLAVAHEDPDKVRWAYELQERNPPDPAAPNGVPNVLRTGEPEFFREIPGELLVQAAGGDEELLRILRELGLRSSIAVPLVAGSSPLGVLTLVSAESGRRYEQADLELALELARRAAVAVENARLYEAAERGAHAARALEHVGDAVILLDRSSTVRYWNPGAERLVGATEAEAVGRPIESLVPDFALVAAAAADGTAMLPLAVAGGERWLSIDAVAFADGTVYALRDVSAERQLERTRSDFVATASHELRTPLAAVYGAARTLRRTDVEISAEDRESFVEMIEEESERLARIVDQILVTGRLDGGDIVLDEAPCDLSGLAASVIESAEVQQPKGIDFALVVAPDLPVVRCDESKLRQVLVNLVENAVKYSPGGGTVEVRLASENGTARIAVRDTGLGIPPGDRERIFEKFFRLDPALARGVGGTGLGLYIVHELVERMGGSVHLESRLGEGSTFEVVLPV